MSRKESSEAQRFPSLLGGSSLLPVASRGLTSRESGMLRLFLEVLRSVAGAAGPYRHP